MGVYKLSDWNDLIDRINDVLTNPASGCTAVDPLNHVTAPHKWAKAADIVAAQNAIKQICNTITFADVPDLWKQSIIDEFNTAISTGWCNCGACSSCGFPGQTTTTFLQSVSIAGCHQIGTSPCDSYGGTYYNSLMAQVETYAANAGNSYQQYALKCITLCQDRKQLAELHIQLTAQQAALTAAIAYWSTHGYSENVYIAPAVIAAQALVDATNAQIATVNANMDTTQAAADALKTYGDAQAALSFSTAAGIASDCPDVLNPISLISGLSHPWPDQVFTDAKCCCNPYQCSAAWQIQVRVTGDANPNPLYQTWSGMVFGRFTPGGKPYVTAFASAPVIGRFTCGSSDCDVGMTLPICQGVSQADVQVLITTYPFVTC